MIAEMMMKRLLLSGVSLTLALTAGACASHGFSASGGLGGGVAANDGGAGAGSAGAVGGSSGGASGATSGGGGAGTGSSRSSSTASNSGGLLSGAVATGADGSAGVLTRAGAATGDLAGTALVTTGNALLTTPSGGLGGALTRTGSALQSDGLGGLPVVGGVAQQTANTADGLVSPAARVVVADRPLLGAGDAGSSQLVGAGVLSANPTAGQVATAGVLSSGTPVTAASQLLSARAGDTQLLGNGSPAVVSAGVLSGSQPSGTVATAGVLPNAATVSGALSPVTGALAPVTGATAGAAAVGAAIGAGAGVSANSSTPALGLVGGAVAGVQH